MVLCNSDRAPVFYLLRVLAKCARILFCPDDRNVETPSNPPEPNGLSENGFAAVNRRHQSRLQVDQNYDRFRKAMQHHASFSEIAVRKMAPVRDITKYATNGRRATLCSNAIPYGARHASRDA